MAVDGVVPESTDNPAADSADSSLRPVGWRMPDVADRELDSCVFVKADRDAEATVAPGIDDVLERHVRIDGTVVDRDNPLQARRLDLGGVIPKEVAKLGEIFE